MAQAPQRFAEWMSGNTQPNKSNGRTYHYHPRSDTHSKAVCRLVIEDLMATCPLIGRDATEGRIVYRVNQPMVNPQDPNRAKTVDLAVGEPAGTPVDAPPGAMPEGEVARVRLSTEAKSTMTEHIKSKPRLYDELNSSHTIVHAAYPDAIAAGLVVVNIAERFASPTNSQSADRPLAFNEHKPPHCAADLIEHLRKLPIAGSVGAYGFDALAVIVVDCDNVGSCSLFSDPPAPQQGDPLHYDSFLALICESYTARFGG